MAAFYLCTSVTRPPVFPGKLVQSTDKIYATLVGVGALLWPAADPVVAAAAKVAQTRHGTKGGPDDELQTIMLAGCLRSLQGGSSGMAGAVIVSVAAGNNGLQVSPTTTWYLADTTAANASVVLAPGSFDGESHIFQVGAGAGNFTVNALNGAANLADPNQGQLVSSFVLSGFAASKSFTWNLQLARWE